jgi:hypothetical protein
MTAQSAIRSVSGDIEVAADPAIAAPGALYAVAFSTPGRIRSFSHPSGVRPHCGGRRLTRTEEEQTIIINRSDRSTYPDRKSVLTSGATPDYARSQSASQK